MSDLVDYLRDKLEHADGAESTGELMTTAQVAVMCHAAAETVRYWRHVGYGPPSFHVGRRVLYDAAKVRAWLAERASS